MHRFEGNQRLLLPLVQYVDVAVIYPESRVGSLNEGIPQCPHQGVFCGKPNRAYLGLALVELGEARTLLKTPSTPEKTRKAKGNIAYVHDKMKDLPDFLPDFEASSASPSSEGEEESDFSDIEESNAASWRQVHRNSRLRLGQIQYREARPW